tara:strand:+ start:21598 stop:21768 length:171 start_codon:yes stop_codon:yes gene_type:complete
MKTYKITRYRLIAESKIYEAKNEIDALNMAKSNVDEWEVRADEVWRHKTEQLVGPK